MREGTRAKYRQAQKFGEIGDGRMSYCLVFLTGFLGLAYEIAIGRLFTPYFGGSVLPWSAAIGVTLFAYSAGYLASAKILFASRATPAWAYWLASAYLMLLLFFSSRILHFFALQSMVFASFAAALCFLFVPCFLWGLILPYFQKQLPLQGAKILSLSTLGSLFGTLAAALFMIPELGLNITFKCLAAVSFFAGLLSLSVSAIKNKRNLIIALFFFLCFFGINRSQPLPYKIIAQANTLYQSYEIRDYEKLRVLFLDGFPELGFNLNQPIKPAHDYYWFCSDLSFFNSREHQTAQKILLIGSGGGMIPFILENNYQANSFTLTTYELDSKLVKIARQHLPLGKTHSPVLIGDGRALLDRTTEKFDSIILDTYLGPTLPEHLMTREFFSLIHDHLTEHGVLIINALQEFATIGMADSFQKTVGQVFQSVFFVNLPRVNQVIVATRENLNREVFLKKLETSQFYDYFQKNIEKINGFSDDTEIITDDRNPFTTKMHLLAHFFFNR